MFKLLGTVVFGVGSSLNAKVLTDKIVFGRRDPNHTRMVVLGTIFMILGEGLRQIEKATGGEEPVQEVE